jgi:hypothetical protein
MCFEPETNLEGEGEKEGEGMADEQIRNELQISISGVQATLQFTNEDETRTRMKSVLKALQRLEKEWEGGRKG